MEGRNISGDKESVNRLIRTGNRGDLEAAAAAKLEKISAEGGGGGSWDSCWLPRRLRY